VKYKYGQNEKNGEYLFDNKTLTLLGTPHNYVRFGDTPDIFTSHFLFSWALGIRNDYDLPNFSISRLVPIATSFASKSKNFNLPTFASILVPSSWEIVVAIVGNSQFDSNTIWINPSSSSGKNFSKEIFESFTADSKSTYDQQITSIEFCASLVIFLISSHLTDWVGYCEANMELMEAAFSRLGINEFWVLMECRYFLSFKVASCTRIGFSEDSAKVLLESLDETFQIKKVSE
jgi:hypothetical protein